MNHAPSPRSIERAMSAAMQVRAALWGDPDPEKIRDERLLADTLDGETDVFGVIDRLIEHAAADAALVRAGKERLARIDARADRTRALIARMLEALELRRLERPLATLTIADGPRSVRITDDAEVPEAYRHSVPHRPLIAAALQNGEAVPGAVLNNSAPALRILTK